MRSISILTSLSFFILIEYTQVYGDVVHLKNRRLIEGEVIEETDNAVNLRTKIGKVVFQRNELESIEKKELPPDFFESLQPSIKKEEVTQPPEKRQGAEGYSEVKPPKFNLNINAEFKKLLEGDAILVNGTTNLPQKAVLYLIFKTQSQQAIAVRKLFVEDSSFSNRIGPFGNKRIPPGRYIVEATFSPERQESEGAKRILAETEEIRAATDLSIGSVRDIEERTNKRKSELASQLKELDRLYNELNREYEAQKDFNEARWNTWLLKWQSQLEMIKSLNESHKGKTLVLDFPLQENVLNEIICDLELLKNRYIAELFKKNKLSFKALPSNDTRDPNLLKKTIQDKLKTSGDFFIASKKSD